MRLESIFVLVLVAGLFFGIVGGIIADFNNNYPEVNAMNGTNFNKYNYASDLNKTLNPIQENINTIGNKESSGWTKILESGSLLWNGVITFITAIITVPSFAISIISGIATELKIPIAVQNIIIPIFITMILGLVIFMLIKWWHRGE